MSKLWFPSKSREITLGYSEDFLRKEQLRIAAGFTLIILKMTLLHNLFLEWFGKFPNQSILIHENNELYNEGWDLSTKTFQPSASTRRAQLSVAVTTVRSKDLLN